MARYWIAVASREHVKKAEVGGFAQVCHGKGGPLKQMAEDDWLVYYSPTLTFGQKDACRHFTALGKITAEQPYTFAMSPDFIPWRRNVSYVTCKEIAIEPLLDKLSFISNKQKWGFPFRRGLFEINKEDFALIAQEMGTNFEKQKN